MTRKIHCQKLQTEAEGLTYAPYPGELGQRIFDNISQQAWEQWQQQQTMLINEYRLNMMESEARQFLEAEMQKYLFGEGSDRPPGYVEQK